MFNKLQISFSVGLKYISDLAKHKYRRYLLIVSSIGIMLGVCALFVSISVMGGFKDNLKNYVLKNIGAVSIYNYGNDKNKMKNILDKNIKEYTMTEGVLIKSFILEDRVHSLFIEGKKEAPKQLSIGNILFQKVNFKKGENINIQYISKGKIKNIILPVQVKDFGLYQYNAQYGVMQLEELKKMFKLRNNNLIKISFNDFLKTSTIANILRRKGFEVKTWMDICPNLFKAIKMETLVISFILAFIILMAGFNLISLQSVFIRDKKLDLAILTSIGGSRSFIMQILFIISFLITILGLLIGDFLGIIVMGVLSELIKLPPDMYYFATLPFSINFTKLILVNIGVIVLVSLCIIIPMYKFSKFKIVDMLRYE